MKKNNILLGILIMAVMVGYIPLLMGYTQLSEHESPKSEVIYSVTSPHVPEHANFAGQKIDISRYDRRERMDRELMAFTYMHSSTMLIIKRANRFFPVIEPILRENDVPEDFKYLMVVESSLNTLAKSPAGACGLWQFLQSTGRENGLEVNNNIDERYHVKKATLAACKYLKESYGRYGDWITVAAAYNAGNGRITSELSKQLVSNAMDLWLVEETSRYMFRIMAAKMVLENPQRYGFLLKKEQLYPPIPYEQVQITSGVPDLAEFARQRGITYAQLKDANPWLRDRSLENRSGRSYTLLIPQKDGLTYNPKKTAPYFKGWVID